MYARLLDWFADSPTNEWIIRLFADGNADTKRFFAEHIRYILRAADETRQRETWNTWLKGYWQNRLSGFPAPLDDEGESSAMVGWTSYLTAVYPEAVDLAVRIPPAQLQNSMALHHLGESALPDQHPESVAQLLLHIGNTTQTHWFWVGKQGIFDRLLQSDLTPESKAGIVELSAKIGPI